MEILALNPAPGRKKRKGRTMASKKRAGSSGATRKPRSTKQVYHLVANPTPNPRGRARRAASAVGRGATWAGVTLALRNLLPLSAGGLMAKVAAKKFGSGVKESEPWAPRDYAIGALAGLLGSVLVRSVMKGKADTAQKILEGAWAFLAMKALTHEVAKLNPTLEAWMGDNGDQLPGAEFAVGDLEQGADGRLYVLGNDWKWRPVDDAHRQLAAYEPDDMAGELVAPGRLGEEFAGSLVSPGRLGAVPDNWVREADAGF